MEVKKMKTLLPAIISAGISVLVFIILHFIIEPHRQRKLMLKERLAKLYAPVYGLLIARLKLGKTVFPNQQRMTLGGMKEHSFLTKETLEELVYNNLSYADLELIETWSEYAGSVHGVNLDISDKFISSVVKEYNLLRKKLKLPYNREELKTGIPESHKHLRKDFK
jgi:hypothetical protein